MEATCCHVEIKLPDGDAQASDSEVSEAQNSADKIIGPGQLTASDDWENKQRFRDLITKTSE